MSSIHSPDTTAGSDRSPSDGDAAKEKGSKLSLGALTALVIGSMVGAGIFGMPQQLAAGTAIGPMLIGWAITGVGMLMLALVYQTLAIRRPDLDAGVFSYARAGLGDLIGSLTAWGYWLAASLGNVAYVVLIMATLSTFFPQLGDGETLLATAIGSVIVWLYAVLVVKGVREAAGVNLIVTIAKLVPLAAFIVFGIAAFDTGLAFGDFWGENSDLGSVMDQVAAMMLVTVWAFLGIEGASNLSSRAKTREDIGRATVVGFLTVLALLVTVNVLSYGMVNRARIEGFADPSMAQVLEAAVGPWGATLIGVGLLLAVGGAFLSWMLMCAEILDISAREGLLPRALSKHNEHDTPALAVWVSAGVIQLFLILNVLTHDPSDEVSLYTQFVLLASSMSLLPYGFSALYQVIMTARGETYDGRGGARTRHMIIGALALVYAIWLIYAGGLVYLLTSAILYAIGIPFFLWARKERGARLLAKFEWVVVVALLAAAGVAAWLLATGRVVL